MLLCLLAATVDVTTWVAFTHCLHSQAPWALETSTDHLTLPSPFVAWNIRVVVVCGTPSNGNVMVAATSRSLVLLVLLLPPLLLTVKASPI
jgi:hypothetical protein